MNSPRHYHVLMMFKSSGNNLEDLCFTHVWSKTGSLNFMSPSKFKYLKYANRPCLRYNLPTTGYIRNAIEFSAQEEFTLSFWFRLDRALMMFYDLTKSIVRTPLVTWGDNSGIFITPINIDYSEYAILFKLRYTDIKIPYDLISTLDEWHHIMLSKEGNIFRTYINGIKYQEKMIKDQTEDFTKFTIGNTEGVTAASIVGMPIWISIDTISLADSCLTVESFWPYPKYLNGYYPAVDVDNSKPPLRAAGRTRYDNINDDVLITRPIYFKHSFGWEKDMMSKYRFDRFDPFASSYFDKWLKNTNHPGIDYRGDRKLMKFTVEKVTYEDLAPSLQKRFQDIEDRITASNTNLSLLNSAIDNEVNRARDAEAALGDRITAEATRATTVENSLSNSLMVETGRAKTEEGNLKAMLNNLFGTSGPVDQNSISNLTKRVESLESAVKTLTAINLPDGNDYDNDDIIEAEIPIVQSPDFAEGDDIFYWIGWGVANNGQDLLNSLVFPHLKYTKDISVGVYEWHVKIKGDMTLRTHTGTSGICQIKGFAQTGDYSSNIDLWNSSSPEWSVTTTKTNDPKKYSYEFEGSFTTNYQIYFNNGTPPQLVCGIISPKDYWEGVSQTVDWINGQFRVYLTKVKKVDTDKWLALKK